MLERSNIHHITGDVNLSKQINDITYAQGKYFSRYINVLEINGAAMSSSNDLGLFLNKSLSIKHEFIIT